MNETPSLSGPYITTSVTLRTWSQSIYFFHHSGWSISSFNPPHEKMSPTFPIMYGAAMLWQAHWWPMHYLNITTLVQKSKGFVTSCLFQAPFRLAGACSATWEILPPLLLWLPLLVVSGLFLASRMELSFCCYLFVCFCGVWKKNLITLTLHLALLLGPQINFTCAQRIRNSLLLTPLSTTVLIAPEHTLFSLFSIAPLCSSSWFFWSLGLSSNVTSWNKPFLFSSPI